MRTINYKIWAEYIYSISKELQPKGISVLEIACGNGAIANMLYKKYKLYYACDVSKNMLNQFSNKGINSACCNMTALSFSKKFDFVFSTFDSINYLKTKKSFNRHLSEVSRVLKSDGIYTFDVSLENNSKKYQKHLNRNGEVDGIKFIQKSRYDEQKRIHLNYFIITLRNGQTVTEKHKQKIYRFEEYFKIIDNSDFYVNKCYNAFTKNDASENSERVQFILKKKYHGNI
jgi:ubiquinone/menaquinone biosynthesis C-methylase UbiE